MEGFRKSIASLRVVADTIEHDLHHQHCTGGGQALANVQESVRSCKAAWEAFHDDIATHEAAMQGSERAARVLHLGCQGDCRREDSLISRVA
ncbi:hypothetical protein COCOBI_10-3830 [Coccomyxa sp. Obi]|nr:hypothetical protein COCOBI_10-3830 [Coccomyxa sp. Obi]